LELPMLMSHNANST